LAVVAQVKWQREHRPSGRRSSALVGPLLPNGAWPSITRDQWTPTATGGLRGRSRARSSSATATVARAMSAAPTRNATR
jgi:hypothetical protein